jgi:VanZ family protein
MHLKFFNKPWPTVIWAAIIFILLAIPGSSIPSEGLFGLPDLDKIIHVFIFGTLVVLWSRYAIFRFSLQKRPVIMVGIVLLSSLFGIGMEYFQKYFVPSRSFDRSDMVADALGSVLAWLLCRFYMFKKIQSP